MSPIKGITDQFRLPRVGKIHLGKKKKGRKGEYPTQLPYFYVYESDTTPAEALAAFQKIYGDEPTELKVQFPTNNPEDWADQYLRYYTQSWGLTCKGDGEQGQAKWDAARKTWADRETEDWEYFILPTCGPGCKLYDEGRCKPVMRLSFLLPDVPGLGIWQLDTSSINSMNSINGMVELVRRITSGRLAFFPFTLTRCQIIVQPKGEKTKTVYIIDLRPENNLTIGQTHALMEDKSELPAGILPTPDEEEVPEDLFPNGEDQGEPVDTNERLPEDAELPFGEKARELVLYRLKDGTEKEVPWATFVNRWEIEGFTLNELAVVVGKEANADSVTAWFGEQAGRTITSLKTEAEVRRTMDPKTDSSDEPSDERPPDEGTQEALV